MNYYLVFICPNCGAGLTAKKNEQEKLRFECSKHGEFSWETANRCSKILEEKDLNQAPAGCPKHLILLDLGP